MYSIVEIKKIEKGCFFIYLGVESILNMCDSEEI